jgi:hypothetical protein
MLVCGISWQMVLFFLGTAQFSVFTTQVFILNGPEKTVGTEVYAEACAGGFYEVQISFHVKTTS